MPDYAQLESLSTRCTILIVTWNCWDLLLRCLNALEEQTLTGFSVVVINNGEASPQQAVAVQGYRNTVFQQSPFNLGFAAGNNRGLDSASDAEWIMLLNPDTVPAPDWVEKMLAATVHYPNFSCFGARLVQMQDPSLLDGDGDCYHISGLAWRSGMGLPVKQEQPREIFSPCAAAALYKMEALKQVGGFDEDFFCYMEDVDLGFRLRLAGYRCLTVPDAQVLHVGSATTGKRSPFYVYHGQRNLMWTYVKNMPGILFWLFLPLHVAINLAGILRYALTGQLKNILRAKVDAIKGIPSMWHKRRAIQQARRVSLRQLLKVIDKHPLPGIERAINSWWK
jgi:GT2 family glycosyltransferase